MFTKNKQKKSAKREIISSRQPPKRMQTMGRSLLVNPKKALPKDKFGTTNNEMQKLRTIDPEDDTEFAQARQDIMNSTFTNKVAPMHSQSQEQMGATFTQGLSKSPEKKTIIPRADSDSVSNFDSSSLEEKTPKPAAKK